MYCENRDYVELDYQMYLYATQADQAISRIVTNEHKMDIIEMLTFSWNECEQSAMNIAKKLNLRKIHLLALQNELDLFIEEFLLEKVEQRLQIEIDSI